MLNIKTVKNNFPSNNSKPYFFKSFCSQTMSISDIASEMADYNSSFTKVDCEGVINILSSVVTKMLTKGYAVSLPFCSIRTSASGSCDDIMDSFIPGAGNNKINYLISIPDNIKTEISSKLEYNQISPISSGNAVIYQICSILPDATENSDLLFSGGDILRIHGKNLSFDFSDSQQGVFLNNMNQKIKISKFSRIGSNIIDFNIPLNLPSGQYTITLKTKPGFTRYHEVKFDSNITVRESEY